jgi:hypothetical protein
MLDAQISAKWLLHLQLANNFPRRKLSFAISNCAAAVISLVQDVSISIRNTAGKMLCPRQVFPLEPWSGNFPDKRAVRACVPLQLPISTDGQVN